MGNRSKADVKHAIDLLWSHQIRRENAALHKQVQGFRQEIILLTKEVKDIRTTFGKVAAVAERANASAVQVEIDHASVRETIEIARHDAQDQSNRIAKVEATLAEDRRIHDQSNSKVTGDIATLKSGLVFLREQFQRQMNQTGATVDRILVNLENIDNQQGLAALKERVGQIESAIQQESKIHSVSRVEDSIDPQAYRFNNTNGFSNDGEQMYQVHAQTSFDTCDETHNDEVMLTLKDAVDDDQSTTTGDLDLDEHVDAMSFARNMTMKTPVTESLRTLPEHESYREPLAEIKALNQERFHSWERYLAEGHALVKKLPRKYESDVVRAFVDGLYAQNQREQCEKWLDVNGWDWEGLTSFGLFGTPSGAIQLGDNNAEKLSAACAKLETHAFGVQPVKALDTAFKKPEKTQQRKSANPRSNPKVGIRRSQRLVQGKLSSQTTDNLQAQNTPRVYSRSVQTKVRQTFVGSKAGWERPRDTKGRFQHLSCSKRDEVEERVGVEMVEAPTETRLAVVTAKSKASTPQVESRRPELRRIVEKATRPCPAINTVTSASPTNVDSGQVTEPPRTPQDQNKSSRLQENIVPRLVKRKGGDDVPAHHRRKRVHLTDDEGLPPVAKQLHEHGGTGLSDRRKQKKKRLPLPPPPEIPIMPTSD